MNAQDYTPPLTQYQVEAELGRISADLERETVRLAIAATRAAEADVNWKRHWSTEFVRLIDEYTQTGRKESDATRTARADLKCIEFYAAKRQNEALERAIRDSCSNKRAQLSALQTVSANVRGQT